MTFHIFYGMECHFKLDTPKINMKKTRLLMVRIPSY